MAHFWILAKAVFRTLQISVYALQGALRGNLKVSDADRWLIRWGGQILRDVRADVEIRGQENLQPWQPMVVMSNHQSLYDIPLLFAVLPPSLRMVSKIELFRVPIWGHAMKATGFIAVDRKNRVKAIRSLEKAKEQLAQGIAIWLAPEGTRTRTGELLPFKKGGFILAEDLGLPILPISIDGTRAILPAKRLRFSPHAKVTVTIHPRVVPGQFTQREALMASVRASIASGLSGPAEISVDHRAL